METFKQICIVWQLKKNLPYSSLIDDHQILKHTLPIHISIVYIIVSISFTEPFHSQWGKFSIFTSTHLVNINKLQVTLEVKTHSFYMDAMDSRNMWCLLMCLRSKYNHIWSYFSNEMLCVKYFGFRWFIFTLLFEIWLRTKSQQNLRVV